MVGCVQRLPAIRSMEACPQNRATKGPRLPEMLRSAGHRSASFDLRNVHEPRLQLPGRMCGLVPRMPPSRDCGQPFSLTKPQRTHRLHAQQHVLLFAQNPVVLKALQLHLILDHFLLLAPLIGLADLLPEPRRFRSGFRLALAVRNPEPGSPDDDGPNEAATDAAGYVFDGFFHRVPFSFNRAALSRIRRSFTSEKMCQAG